MTTYERLATQLKGAKLLNIGHMTVPTAEVDQLLTDLRSHEPPRNSGEGAAVDGPTPLEEKDDANAPA